MQSVTAFLKLSLVLAISAMLIAGCANTIIPKQVVTNQTSFSGNSQNGGFIGWMPDGGGVIDEGARAKYNALIHLYSTNFLPPLTNDFGLTTFTNGTYLITKQGLSDFWQMNEHYKNSLTNN